MKFTRHASANWKGTGLEGVGTISTQSTTLDNAQLSFKTRFKDGVGTNPEELIGAAHAGCLAMKFSFVLNERGFTAENVDIKVNVQLEDHNINLITIELSATIPDMTEEAFQDAAEFTRANCLITQLFNCEVQMSATLVA